MHKQHEGFTFILAGIFILLLAIVFSTFLALHHSIYPVIAFSSSCILLFMAFFSRYIGLSNQYRNLATFLSFIIIVVSGLVFPNDLESIEEMYFLIPLLYLFILPGTLWPIPIAFALLSAYFPTLADHDFIDWLEDALELIVISSFATVMSFFQQKSLRQMQHFKLDSYTDYLTGLSNRKNFMKQMERLLQLCNSNNIAGFALLSIDLDGFKKINDQLGHLAGDQVLKQVAMRLEKMTGPGVHAFRTGGDEFAFLISLEEHTEKGKQENLIQQRLKDKSINIANCVIALSEQAYKALNKHYNISTSVGIAFYPQDACDMETLYSNADLAMYSAKASGKNCCAFYEQSIMQKAARRYELEDDLKTAISNNELFLQYQPKVSLSTGKITSAEALLRWQHPRYGFISPMEFIPIAEDNLLIIPIGQWVLEQVCHQIVKWQCYPELKTVAANVSSTQLTDANFVNSVRDVLALTSCPGHALEIEQTESCLMDDPDNNVELLKQLKELGISLSLDDFGTAYSSLSQLGRLPLDILKIDKSFIDNCVHNERDHMIVRTIIQLGHNLGMKIVAEGVEYEAQRQLLEDENCEYYQGYLFSRPVNVDEFELLLKKER